MMMVRPVDAADARPPSPARLHQRPRTRRQQSFFNALTHFSSNGNPDSLNQTVSVANAMFDEAKASNMRGDPGTLARLSDSSGKAEAQIAAF